jgi:hypothetical protein
MFKITGLIGLQTTPSGHQRTPGLSDNVSSVGVVWGGTLITDALQEYSARNTHILSLKGQMRLSMDLMEYIVKNMLKMYFMISNEASFFLTGGSLG